MMDEMESPGEDCSHDEVRPLTPAEVQDIVLRNNPSELLYVPIAVSLHSEDFKWAQDVCVELARYPDATVRGNAVLALGHLARRFKKLDQEAVRPIFLAAIMDPEEYVREQAEDILDDVRYYLGLGPRWPHE